MSRTFAEARVNLAHAPCRFVSLSDVQLGLARDAAEPGFGAAIIEDATKALSDEDFAKIKEDLKEKGVSIAPSETLRNPT